ncbi:hypothetical protein GCM10010353_32910 [Streptomyces chryseus]|nr:hypothetical protein GCM10010353_32910 [Streptomyces chryseus]
MTGLQRGAREDLDGAGHVQALDAVEEDDEHAAYGSLGHGSILRRPTDVRNDEDPTFPATGPRHFPTY